MSYQQYPAGGYPPRFPGPPPMQPPPNGGAATSGAVLGLVVAVWNVIPLVLTLIRLIAGARAKLATFTELVTIATAIALLIVGAIMVLMRRLVGRILMVSGNGIALVSLTYGPPWFYLILAPIVASIILLCLTSTARWLESAPAAAAGLAAPPPGYPQPWYPPPHGGRRPGW